VLYAPSRSWGSLREQEALAARAAIDPEQSQEKALALEGEAFAAWLLAPEGS
jgi:hypothetical protein